MSDALIPPGGKHSKTLDTYSGLRLPLEKVVAILDLYDKGHSPTDIAAHVQSDPRIIGGVLRNYKDRPTSAKALLVQAAPMAAHAWREAITIASARGNHQPAKDLLAHVGAVDNPWGRPAQANSTNVAVQVVIGTPDSPIPHDPVTASGFALSTVPNPKPIK